jgi:hypothetical protein
MTMPTQGDSKPEALLMFSSAECSRHADLVRAYCESRFPVGPHAERMRSVTGETFTELCIAWPSGFATIEQAAEAAMAAFRKYAEGKSGTLYWRIVPEIAYGAKQKKFAYYMRLLISDKPTKET